MGRGADHRSLVIPIVRRTFLILLEIVIRALASMSDRCFQFWVCGHVVQNMCKIAPP